jgi:hypothetical protein
MKAMVGLLMVVGLALGGCGNNECEDAVDKFKECGLPVEGTSGDGDCSGVGECYAKCVNAASCEEIKSTTGTTNFDKCTTACLGG